MQILKIQGPTVLNGRVCVQGSKNAVLPMMAAAVINADVTVIDGCPDISDVHDAMEILRAIGCSAEYNCGKLTIDSSGPINPYIPCNIMNRIRASIIFTGALLARCGSFRVSHPGGCNIGLRPIDIHIDAIKQLGALVEYNEREIICRADKLKNCDVNFRFPSVGATENIMILASAIRGKTRIINAAREPEITDLGNMLIAMGVKISGTGSSVITIEGTDSPCRVSYRVMPDRIDTATYLSAVCTMGGKLIIENADASHLVKYIDILKRCGANIDIQDKTIVAEKLSRLKGGINVATAPYPGFATDMQSLIMTVFSVSDGVSVIKENIFENRFCLANTLQEMGADIRIYGQGASLRGVRSLKSVSAPVCDLRSGAALAIAMMAAEGTSYLSRIRFIDRGYENFEDKFTAVGANIERIESTNAKNKEFGS